VLWNINAMGYLFGGLHWPLLLTFIFLGFSLQNLVSTLPTWGKEGHQIVAQIGSDRLTAKATKVVKQFIGDKTLADIAPLPDNYDHSTEGKWSGPCHYCNLPRGATNFSMKYCPDFCVVKSIQNYTNILQNTWRKPTPCDFSTGHEPCALEFLVHYVGDIHQPLHVGYGDDEGGNLVVVYWYDKKNRTSQCLGYSYDSKVGQQSFSCNQ